MPKKFILSRSKPEPFMARMGLTAQVFRFRNLTRKSLRDNYLRFSVVGISILKFHTRALARGAPLYTKYYILTTILAIALSGCATVSTPPITIQKMLGVYHRVKKGQTLWRISKVYGVKMEDIARANRLADTSRIYTGQLVFIPGANQTLEELLLQTDFADKAGDFSWPVNGKVISFFGMKKDQVQNKGIYIQTKKGANVRAARSGKISFCSDQFKGYGRIIILDHLDGYSTVYAQNLTNLVKLNQLVKQGQVIANTETDSRTNSSELYFEIRQGHKAQNPFFYLP